MGKQRIIAETGAGQHGVATATVCARFGLRCVVYMGAEDMRRQALNVFRMQLLGAEVVPVESGTRTLKDATNEAMRDWVDERRDDTITSSARWSARHPFPRIVRDFQSVIGREAQEQMLERDGRLPDAVVACVGGGSNAMGIFTPVHRGRGRASSSAWRPPAGARAGRHAASLTARHARRAARDRSATSCRTRRAGEPAHSVSAGLDYPGVGPEHSLSEGHGPREVHGQDDEALAAFQARSRLEGIIPRSRPRTRSRGWRRRPVGGHPMRPC